MTRLDLNAARRAAAVAAAAVVLLLAVGQTIAGAAPDTIGARPASENSTARVGVAQVSVVTTETAVPVGGSFSYTTSVRTRKPLDFVQIRMQLFMPDSRRLVYQKTFIQPNPKDNLVQFRFDRSIADIGLDAGAYPVEMSVRLVKDGRTSEGVVPTTLLVYDSEKVRLPVSVIARVSALPMTGPDGALVIDPAQFTRARDDVDALCGYVISDPTARLTLALSPAMLEDWRIVSRGYRFEGPEGTVEVGENSPVAREYASVLQELMAAVASGRLELMSTGYGDPNLAELAAADLLEDVRPQYELGASTVFASIESSASTGTAPAGGSVPAEAIPLLERDGTGYAVVRAKWTRAQDKTAKPGAYRVGRSGFRVLVSDDGAVRALTASPTAEAITQAFDRHRETSGTPFPLAVTIGPGAASADAVIDFATTIEAQPWATLSLARDAVSLAGKSSVDLRTAPADNDAPAGHWRAVAEGRSWARALSFAIGPNAEEAASAERDSLLAEGSAWSEPLGAWRHAERSIGYAASAQRNAEGILSKVTMSAKPVTLAGTKGEVPVTIVNRTGRELRVRLVALPSSGIRLGSRPVRELVLQPQENFVEVPVDLLGSVSGTLRIRLSAGPEELAETTVALRASIIDKLAIVAGIVVVLVGLLAFIILKVRAAEERESDTAGADDRYT